MKTFRHLGFLIAALAVAAPNLRADNTAALNEVVKLKNAGLGDDAIVSFIQSKNANYDLSVDTIISLKNQGVSSAILNAMMSSGKGAPVAAPSPYAPAVSVPNAPVVPPAPTITTTPTLAQPVVVAPQPPPISVTPAPVTVTTTTTYSTAQPTVVDDVTFSQALTPYGSWIITEDGQKCWRPTIAVAGGWRPYWNDGHWTYTDQGWYWASDYPWGWAAFHYGRWHQHPRFGWVWFPDTVWSPAWVVWRNGGDYCGWAPMPRYSSYDFATGAYFYHGRRVEAGFDFGLGWNAFGFTYVREMGEPPHEHFRSEAEIRGIYARTTIDRTVVSVGIGGARVSIVQGVDPHRVGELRGHPVEVVKVEEIRRGGPVHGNERIEVKTVGGNPKGDPRDFRGHPEHPAHPEHPDKFDR